jgi:hypothetical protein
MLSKFSDAAEIAGEERAVPSSLNREEASEVELP